MYESPKETYRDRLVKDKHSKDTTPDNQWGILDFMLEQLQEYRKGDHVIFDRCPLDNIVYSLWATDKGIDGFDTEFIDKCIPLVRESMKFIDIMFFIPITSAAPIEIEGDGIRETDKEYISEIDNIFKAMYQQWLSPDSRFFPADDKPAIIEVFGNRVERRRMMQLYLDEESGEMVEGEGIMDVNEVEDIERQFRNSDSGYTDTNDVKKFII